MNKINKVKCRLNNYLVLKESIYLFGAGGAASWALQGFIREGIEINGFLDDNANNLNKIDGFPIYLPNSEEIDISTRANSKVVFMVMNPNVEVDKIEKRMLDLGWKEFISFEDFVNQEYINNGKRCSMLDPIPFENNKTSVHEARSLLSDKESLKLFDAFISFCCQDKVYDFPAISQKPYFPTDLPRWSENLRIIDCGAYTGDTILSALENKYKIESCYCFEPDPGNFSKLVKTLKTIPNSYCWPCGVFSCNKTFKFSSGGDTGSSISHEGDISIQCVALDDVIPNCSPNLIKFDIEGSEQAALKGAKNLIRKYRPMMAISVYHLSTDIWKIPLYINSIIGPRAKYFLRKHSRSIADTVLYIYPD